MSREKLIYIASPYAGDIETNTAFAKKACRYAIHQGHTPIAVHLLYPQMLDDAEPTEREIGLRLGHRVLEVCDELWLCGGRVSSGMAREIEEAQRLGIPIRQIGELEIKQEALPAEMEQSEAPGQSISPGKRRTGSFAKTDGSGLPRQDRENAERLLRTVGYGA